MVISPDLLGSYWVANCKEGMICRKHKKREKKSWCTFYWSELSAMSRVIKLGLPLGLKKKLINLLKQVRLPLTLRPLHTRARVESLNFQLLRVWCLEITISHAKLKVLITLPIFKPSILWASVKWPCWKWAFKGGMILHREAFMTSQIMLECPLASLQNESMSSWHSQIRTNTISSRLWLWRFDD